MPELPEVETVRRTLSKEIINLKITGIEIFYPKMLEIKPDTFKEILINHSFIDIRRYGKYLIFDLDNGYSMISHLRMEGKYFYQEEKEELNKHIHLVFHFENNMTLRYQDVRKFGRINVIKRDEVFKTKELKDLGYEPFDAKLTKNVLFDYLKNKKTTIKTLLLSQKIIVGLGNIYVDEVLFASKIDPHRLGCDISLNECEEIIKNSISILQNAILYKGTTIRSYTSSLGVYGEYQNYLQVHTKESCPLCGKKLHKDKINGRTSYYCASCQK